MSQINHVIGMVAYNGGAFLEMSLESVLASADQLDNTAVVVVDNASGDETRSYLERRSKEVPFTLIRNEINRGFPAGCNQLFDWFAEHSKSYRDIFTLTHTDVYWPLSLAAGIQVVSGEHPFAVVAPYTSNTGESEILTAFGNRLHHSHAAVQNYRSSDFYKNLEKLTEHLRVLVDPNMLLEAGLARIQAESASCPILRLADNSCITFTRQLLDEVGYFDEIFFPGMGEDSDWHRRLAANDLTYYKTPALFMHHWCSISYVRSGNLDGPQVHDMAMTKLAQAVKERDSALCLRRSCVHHQAGGCSKGCSARRPGVCGYYELNPAYVNQGQKVFL